MVTETQKIPSGYKQTEIGMIPKDWTVKTFRDLCWVNQGLQIAIEKRLKNPTTKSKKYITIQYLNDGKETEYIDDYSPSVCCVKDDILMTRTGNTGIVISGAEGVFHNNFFKINFDKKQIEKDYLLYYLKDNKTKRIILEKAGTSTIPDLNHSDFYSIQIPLPPSKTERSAISNALSDTDILIEKLEKVLEKKKNIKQGAMQELLTGKRRLPGFKSEWKTAKLGDCFTLSATYSKTKFINDSGNFLIMDMGSVSSVGKMIASKRTISTTDLLKVGDLVMPKDDIGGGNIIGKVAYIDQDNKYILGDHVYKLAAKDLNISTLFFAYLINSHVVNSELKKKVSGSAQLGLGRKSVEEQDVKIPKDKDEQTEIANVLSDMDAEIEKLESQLSKYQNIKQGMMQTLLTGKIRLIHPVRYSSSNGVNPVR